MNQLEDLLAPERVLHHPAVGSKKRALELLAEVMVSGLAGIRVADALASLVERERLGSTGLGHGAAIPHGRLEGLERAVCAFLLLDKAVDFDATDEAPVDMICGLLVPENSTSEHLGILALLAEMFSDAGLCARLKAARSDREIHDLLVGWERGGASSRTGG